MQACGTRSWCELPGKAHTHALEAYVHHAQAVSLAAIARDCWLAYWAAFVYLFTSTGSVPGS